MERKKTRLKLWPIALMPAAVWGNMLVPVARAQIAPDGSLPTEVVRDGNNFTIEGGQSAGSNLFHSFQEFSVPTGGRAYFNNDMDVENIFSRVTGGNISNIDGLIRANGSANLFLLNPAGIVFGPNARLNIGGSFLGSTASSLLFPNGREFRAINQPEPLLTINAPIGLWFRGNEGNIVNQAATRVRLNNGSIVRLGLRVQPGQSLGLVGGNVRVNGGIIRAPGGRVELGGLTAAGTVGLNNDGSLSFPEGVARGNVEFANFARVNVRRDGGGTITVNANDVNILGGTRLRSGIRPGLGSADARGGNITIDATGAIAIDGSIVANQVGVQAIGDAGNIEIEGRSLFLSNGAQLINSNLGQGNVGNVTINVDSIELTSGSGIFADVQPETTGNGGELRIETDRLLVADGSQVSASTFGMPDAGNLNISATESVELRGNGSGLFADVLFGTTVDGAIVPATGAGGDFTIATAQLIVKEGALIGVSTFGAGNGGNLSISTTESVEVSGSGSGILAQVRPGATGNGGALTLSTGKLIVEDGAEVSINTLGEGNAGSLNISATESVELSGVGSDILAQVSLGATGNGGDLTLSTGKLTVEDGAEVSASTFGEGNAGSLNISATESVEVRGIGSGLLADVTFEMTADGAIVPVPGSGTGAGGDLTLSTGKLIVEDGAEVSARTLGAGNAGNMTIRATESVEVRGGGLFTDVSSQMTASGAIAIGTGTGGNLQISTAQLIVEDGKISANTSGQGNAGNLTISNAELVKLSGDDSGLFAQVLGETTVGGVTFPPAIGNGGELNISTNRLIVEDGASASASTFGIGDAGNLTIKATESVTVSSSGSGLFAQVRPEATGNGGLLQITTGELLVQEEASVSVRTIGQGNANNLIIKTDRLRVRSGGQISASTFGPGNAGNLTVNASELIELTGAAAAGSTGIFSSAIAGTGNGGNLEIGTEELIIQDGASIGVSNFQSQNQLPPGSGNPGNINIQAGSVLLNDGRITAAAVEGDRGNIGLTTSGNIELRDRSRITANATGEATGGNIEIETNFLIAYPGNNDITANANRGDGGKIEITAEAILGIAERDAQTGGNDITVSSTFGREGEVIFNIPDVESLQGRVEPSDNAVEAEEVVVPACRPDPEGEESSFTIIGRGGVPRGPQDPLTSDTMRVGGKPASQTAETRPPIVTLVEDPEPISIEDIVPARGWIVNEDGVVELTAYPTPYTSDRPFPHPVRCPRKK